MAGEAKELPKECPSCSSGNVRPHCPSAFCRWLRCVACKAVTGFAQGELRTVK